MEAFARTSVPAVHEWHIERILAELGILDAVVSGSAHCLHCDDALTVSGIGAIVRAKGNRVLLTCERARCIEAASARAASQ